MTVTLALAVATHISALLLLPVQAAYLVWLAIQALRGRTDCAITAAYDYEIDLAEARCYFVFGLRCIIRRDCFYRDAGTAQFLQSCIEIGSAALPATGINDQQRAQSSVHPVTAGLILR